MDNINIDSFEKLDAPDIIKDSIPSSQDILNFVEETRDEIKDIITGVSKRKLFMVLSTRLCWKSDFERQRCRAVLGMLEE